VRTSSFSGMKRSVSITVDCTSAKRPSLHNHPTAKYILDTRSRKTTQSQAQHIKLTTGLSHSPLNFSSSYFSRKTYTLSYKRTLIPVVSLPKPDSFSLRPPTKKLCKDQTVDVIHLKPQQAPSTYYKPQSSSDSAFGLQGESLLPLSTHAPP
jgi:hypothetical protein